MYLSALSIRNFRQFGDLTPGFVIHFNAGVTALVGENDAGKTAVIDALRHVLQTRDSDFLRLELEDFHVQSNGEPATDITLVCTLSGLSTLELGAFAEYVTFSRGVGVLHVHWSARRLALPTASRRWVDIQVRCGARGEGPALDVGARQLLATAYLKPLRDAEREMSPGRNSRLSQVLGSFPSIESGDSYVQTAPPGSTAEATGLSIAGMGDYMRELVRGHEAIKVAQATINDRYLEPSHLLASRFIAISASVIPGARVRSSSKSLSGLSWGCWTRDQALGRATMVWAQIIYFLWPASSCCLARSQTGFRSC